ncbi:HNH endonuclease [Salsuginibacillus kocurii]|uniref:HNH endonuclease n=1 Tax=Salsuginibacillus kocurii TaxID=427078 RepID=UPI000380DE05|nr:HNH endonuclease [Salsuginibacillus kocurii]
MKKKSIRNGYKTIYLPTHPKANQGYIYEHIYIMEQMKGRYIKEDEHVHHLDTNNLNNHHENLILIEKGQHTKLHNYYRRHNLYEALKATGKDKYKVKECFYCNNYLFANEKFCNNGCQQKYRAEKKNNRPSKERLEKLLEKYNKVEIGNLYGVHRTTINNWLSDDTTP